MTRPGRWQRLVVAGGFAMFSTVVGEHHAFADSKPTAHVVVVSQSNGSARLLLTVRGFSDGGSVLPSSVHVDVDGEPASASATPIGPSGSASVARRAVLVFDTSGSMAGPGIAGARRAALAFVASVPGDVEVGLVAFADRPRLVLAPTRSRAALTQAVGQLAAAGETSLYDGVNLGLHVLGESGERALIVLSDGADTRSRDSLSSVTTQLKTAGVRMDAVALHTADSVTASLKQMAAAGDGRVTAASNAAALASAFSAAARRFASDVILNVQVPAADEGRSVPVDVTVASSMGALRASTTLRIIGTKDSVTIPQSKLSPVTAPKIPVTLTALVYLAMFVPLLVLFIAIESRSSAQARTRRLLHRYTLNRSTTDAQDMAVPTGLSRVSASLLAVADRVAANPARRDKLLTRLSRADVTLTPGEWIAVRAVVAFAAGMLGVLLFSSPIAGFVLAAGGLLASGFWLSFKGRRRLRAFDEHLPSALQLVAGSLRSGFSLAQALDGVVREGVDPIAAEVSRALAEARLGMPIEDALDGIGDRMDSSDFRWVVMAIRIQREVGGNLAEILLTTAGVMRERARLRRQVKALSAEGRLSAYVLLSLPLVLSAYMFAFRRSYIRTLYTTGVGIGMLTFAIFLCLMGALWMRKIVTVEA